MLILNLANFLSDPWPGPRMSPEGQYCESGYGVVEEALSSRAGLPGFVLGQADNKLACLRSRRKWADGVK